MRVNARANKRAQMAICARARATTRIQGNDDVDDGDSEATCERGVVPARGGAGCGGGRVVWGGIMSRERARRELERAGLIPHGIWYLGRVLESVAAWYLVVEWCWRADNDVVSMIGSRSVAQTQKIAQQHAAHMRLYYLPKQRLLQLGAEAVFNAAVSRGYQGNG